MPNAEHTERANALLQYYGETYAEQAGIQLKDTPAPLFQLLILALMLSARIAADKAVSATRALFEAGFTTPQKMAEATWQQRVDAITWSGYKRYDERTATMLGHTADQVLERYKGDLRLLHQAAQGKDTDAKELLTEFKGIGAVGADIFMREVQAVWDDFYPFADTRIIRVATELELPDTPGHLSQLCSKKDFPRLCAALMQVKLKREQQTFLKRLERGE